MSDWDEKADEAAVRHHTFESMTGEDNERIRYGFWNGAKWQREQYRAKPTTEQVERMIMIIGQAGDGITVRGAGQAAAELLRVYDIREK